MDLLAEIKSEKDVENFEEIRVEQSKGLPHMFYVKYQKTDDVKEGRPVYIGKDYIKIQTDEINCIDTEVTKEYKDRYPESWKTYNDNKESPNIEGTLLTECNFMPMTDALSYRDMGLFTVEQLVTQRENPSVDCKLVDIAQSYVMASKIEGGMHYLIKIIKQQKAEMDIKDKTIEKLRREVNDDNST